MERQVARGDDRSRRASWPFATAMRPSAERPQFGLDIQDLIEDARNATLDVIVAEALDRLSRDQEDVAGLFKRMQFAGGRACAAIARASGAVFWRS